MRRLVLFALLTTSLSAGSVAAQGTISLSFAQGGVDVSTLNVTEGQSFTLQVYLNTANSTLFQNKDLSDVGIRTTLPANAVTSAGVIANTTTVPAPAGDPRQFITFNNTPGLALTSQPLQVGMTGSAAPLAFGANDRILLGTLNYTAGLAGIYQVNVAAFDPSDPGGIPDEGSVAVNNLTFGDPVAFGNLIIGSNLTLTIAPVPEPATVLAVGAVGLALASARRRWRAKRQAAPAGESAAV